MTIRVGINGMGRVGRMFWRACRAHSDLDVVAINDLAPPESLAHLMKYDSVRGRLDTTVTTAGSAIVVDGGSIQVSRHDDPGRIPWHHQDVDVVLEATGRFVRAHDARRHLDAGARRVLISTATADPDITIMMGLSEDRFDPRHHRIVSAACCTSSSVAPIIAVLRGLARIVEASLSTVHAYDSNKSALTDSPHLDPRMGRAAAVNLVPARLKPASLNALATTFPELQGRIDGWHVRAPVAVGCVADLVLRMDRALTVAEVNEALAAAAGNSMKGFLGYTEDPIVSTDIIGVSESCTVDGNFTAVIGESIKILGWYDNEWGFAHRLAEAAKLIGGHPLAT